ncbi:hypothetical protein CEXT_808681 [Caerostris extrusa]|uniref:Uncharacterized protein n=1 Tax=Caerostris extrusa TaxID=172846 RepID=A0AAV4Y687_CAEEX|nr:hypothetical protein CEXT_808681 [Caerostris extrusa]
MPIRWMTGMIGRTPAQAQSRFRRPLKGNVPAANGMASLTTAYQSSQYSKQTDIDRLKMELELLQLFLGLLFSIPQ